MGWFIKTLRLLVPTAKIVATATPNKIDDALVALIEQVLDNLPDDETDAINYLGTIRTGAMYGGKGAKK